MIKAPHYLSNRQFHDDLDEDDMSKDDMSDEDYESMKADYDYASAKDNDDWSGFSAHSEPGLTSL